MATEDLDALLQRMDAIAKAVNSFTSETVQHEAFSALISAFAGTRHKAKVSPASSERDESEPEDKVTEPPAPTGNSAKAGKAAAKGKRSSKGSMVVWKFVSDLDLHPSGQQSFDEFIAEKQPASNEDRYSAVVYYLSEILKISSVSIHQVGSIFRLTKSWKEPTNVEAGLRVAAYRKGTLDTKDYENIKITPAGRNFVEHDLPPKTKATK